MSSNGRKNKRNIYIKIEGTKGPENLVRKDESWPFMTKRLDNYVKPFKTAKDIMLYFKATSQEDEHKISKMLSEFPYYLVQDVSKVFDFKMMVPGHVFDLQELPIINDRHFVSIRGLYKLFMFSDYSFDEKIRVIKEFFEKTDQGIRTRFIQNKSKWPVLIFPEVTYNPLKFDGIKNFGKIAFRLGDRDLHDELFKRFEPEVTCEKSKVGVVTGPGKDFFGESSDKIVVKKQGKNITLNKKSRPLLGRPVFKTREYLSILSLKYPELFTRALFSQKDDNNDISVPSDLFKDSDKIPESGMMYESTNGTLSFIPGLKDDRCADVNISKGYPIYDISILPDAFSSWSFEEIVLYYGR